MAEAEKESSTARNYEWPFEFTPYPIQHDFMNQLYLTLNDGLVGIFESPTGTGKSLSIICSALHWLSNNRGKHTSSARKMKDKCLESEKESAGKQPAWIAEFSKQKSVEDEAAIARRIEQRRQRVEANLQKKKLGSLLQVNGRVTWRNATKKRKMADPLRDENGDDWSDYGPEEYESGEEAAGYASESDFDSDSSGSSVEAKRPDEKQPRRILFCSRTHSQLSQFLHEVKRTRFGKDIPCVALGSRKQLCVNEHVRRLGGSQAMNEKCLDLQSNSSTTKTTTKAKGDKPPGKSSCPYYDKSSVKRVRDLVLYEAQDIESVQMISKEMHTCGYYAARAAVDEAELICLPYSMLLQKSSREALGIDVKGSVIICDEAHNLIEAINQTYSVCIDVESISQAKKELEEYKSRYASRLKAKNKLYISHLVYVTSGLVKFLASINKATTARNLDADAKGSSDFELLSPGELLLKAKVDHVNLFKLVRYIKLSKLTHKLRGFAAKHLTPYEVELHSKGTENPRPRSSLQAVYNFLDALLNADSNGKILVLQKEKKLKFLMLNAAVHFRSIVDEAHAVVLAGGTMQPTDDVISQLFGHVSPEHINLFSCGHVIPKANMLCAVVSTGPCNTPIELTYQNRSQTKVMDEIGRVVSSICKVVPSGVVVFFPSYRYEEELTKRWERNGTLKAIKKCKRIFREERAGKQPLEQLLTAYGESCKGDGAVLFSVVGGKLSEGINFKDHLARCVIMVGLPFPNRSDPELQVKMNYLDKAQYSSKEFYENQCMKAVNQCIGRSIRHKGDYASVILVDGRYKRLSISKKLPKWIAQDMLKPDKFGPVYGALHQYFKEKRKANSYV